jgi:hypothetical protein
MHRPVQACAYAHTRTRTHSAATKWTDTALSHVLLLFSSYPPQPPSPRVVVVVVMVVVAMKADEIFGSSAHRMPFMVGDH